MSGLDSLGFGVPRVWRQDGTEVERIIVQRPLQRVLAFLGRSIHDVVNDPIVKSQVYGFYKLHKQVQRTCEVVDLERWWNGKGL